MVARKSCSRGGTPACRLASFWSPKRSALPPITLSDRDLARLEALLESPAVAALPVARALSDELARANVVPAAAVPADVVT